MRNISVLRVGDLVYYSVFNSRGELALYTSNRSWAYHIARAFVRNPETRVVVVHEARVGPPKR